MTNWAKLLKLNGGKAIYRIKPYLEAKNEMWFLSSDPYETRIFSRGKVQPNDGRDCAEPVTERLALYSVAAELAVEIEMRGAHPVLRRGKLNSPLVSTFIEPTDVETTLAWYRALGFRDGFGWNATKTRVTRRNYLFTPKRGTPTTWWVQVDGAWVEAKGETKTKHKTRDEAIALAEAKICAKEKAGYRLVSKELMPATAVNPEPGKKKALPKKPVLAAPKTSIEAVDAAVAVLRDLHERLPKEHFVTELVNPKSDASRVASVEQHPAFFMKMHKARVGRWLKTKPAAAQKNESSWAYFVRIYGSMTWVLSGQADRDLEMFYPGEVIGGGWSCLEVADDVGYDTRDHAEATGNEAFSALRLFHGGWLRVPRDRDHRFHGKLIGRSTGS